MVNYTAHSERYTEENAEINRRARGSLGCHSQGFASCATGFLGHALPYCSLPGEEHKPKHLSTPVAAQRIIKPPKLFSQSCLMLPTLKMSPQPEQTSTTRLQKPPHTPAEQSFAAAFSTCQSNPQWWRHQHRKVKQLFQIHSTGQWRS